MADVPSRRLPGNPGHRDLLAELERIAGHGPTSPIDIDPGDSYASSGRAFYRVSVPERRRLAKQWLAQRRAETGLQILGTASSLLGGRSFEERTIGCMLLQYSEGARRVVTPYMVEQWLEDLVGWAEVDSLCQSVFGPDDLLNDWASWRKVIMRLAHSGNPNQRRGALVLLTGPVRRSDDSRLRDLAFRVIDDVKQERIPLVAKAVSWLLRALVERHARTVSDYVEANAAELAPIAVRETRVKLRTGTKGGSRGSAAAVRHGR